MHDSELDCLLFQTDSNEVKLFSLTASGSWRVGGGKKQSIFPVSSSRRIPKEKMIRLIGADPSDIENLKRGDPSGKEDCGMHSLLHLREFSPS